MDATDPNSQLPPPPPAAPPAPPKEVCSVAAAGILNWLYPGAGYFIIGQNTKGIVFCCLTFFSIVVAFITCGLSVVLHTPYMIAVIVDAVLLAQRRNRGETIREWQFF